MTPCHLCEDPARPDGFCSERCCHAGTYLQRIFTPDMIERLCRLDSHPFPVWECRPDPLEICPESHTWQAGKRVPCLDCALADLHFAAEPVQPTIRRRCPGCEHINIVNPLLPRWTYLICEQCKRSFAAL